MKELICPKHKCRTPFGKCMELEINKETGLQEVCDKEPVMSSTIFWCENCNVPMFDECCSECGEKGLYIATDIRPVFPEEKILLAILLKKENALEFENCSVWNTGNTYFINGEKVKVSIKTFNQLPLEEIKQIKQKYDEYVEKIDYRNFDEIIDVFIKVNNRRYAEITDEAIAYVQSYKDLWS